MPRSITLSSGKRVWFVVAFVLVQILPVLAWAQGATNPTFTRIQQGSTFDAAIVSCATSSTALLNCAPSSVAGAGDWRAVTCINDGSNKVYLCPGLDNSGNCNTCVAATKGYVVLAAGASFTFGASARNLGLSCIASGGASTVRCYAER